MCGQVTDTAERPVLDGGKGPVDPMTAAREERHDDLLSFVLDANGGLDRWAKASVLTADVSVGGAFWGRKGWPGLLGGETMTLDTRREHIELAPLGGPGRSSVFDTGPERLAILAADGTVIGQRDHPRASFTGFDRTTPWDLPQVRTGRTSHSCVASRWCVSHGGRAMCPARLPHPRSR
jgi:hypothetical protein